MALIASTSSPSCPNGCRTTSLRRLSPVTVAVCALSPHPSLAGAAYALQPPPGGVPLALRARFRAAVLSRIGIRQRTPPPNRRNTKCHFHHPPTQQLSSGSSRATPSCALS